MDPSTKKTSLARSLNIDGYYSCSREEARELFAPFIFFDGMYLVRPSESKGALYTLSVTKDGVIYNYRIQQDTPSNLFFLNDTEKFSSIQSLIQGYKENAINPECNIKLVAPVVQGKTRKQDSNGFINNYNKRQQGYGDLPGLHPFLPRSEVKKALKPYRSMTGAFLVRPSSTEEGSLTLSIIHKTTILNLKINQDPTTKEVCIAAKKFASFEQLLDYYKHHSLKARGREDEKILLKYPIPIDKALERIHRMAQDELYTTLAGKLPAPPSPSTKPKEPKHKPTIDDNVTPTPITGDTVESSNAADSLLDQALKELKAVQDELTIEIAASATVPTPQKILEDLPTVIANQETAPVNNSPSVTECPPVVGEPPVMKRVPNTEDAIPNTEDVKLAPTIISATDENRSPIADSAKPSADETPTLITNKNKVATTSTTGRTVTSAPPPLPPPLPPISGPMPTPIASKKHSTSGTVCAEDLIDMQQRLKTPSITEDNKRQSGGGMQDIFGQFKDKISLMRAMVEHSDDEDYEEEWD